MTPVTSGRRVSVALYVLKGWETLGQDLLEDLGELGFPLPDQTSTSLSPAAATVELKPAEVQALPGDDLTDLTYDEAVANGTGEHLESNIQGNDGTPTSLTPSQVELLREHVRSGHLKKSHLCKPCMEAEGPVRRHISHSKKRAGVGHIDICGPMPLSWEGHRYVLVLGLRLLDDAPLLISARGLTTRPSVEATAALGEMIDEFESYDLTELPLSNGKRILTIQSDRAREFESRNFTEFCRDRGLTHTVTKGYDPAANGTAERVVGLIKSGLRKLLASTA